MTRPNVKFIPNVKDHKEFLLGRTTSDNFKDLPEVAFIDPKSPKRFDKIALSSFSRSGNTMLRGYLEKITGIATGSDGSLLQSMVKVLMDGGFVGEGLMDNRVQVIKTHYPEKIGVGVFPSDRTLLIIRNPLDTLVSDFNLITSGSHDESILDSDFDLFKKEWNTFVKDEIRNWAEFHEWWLKAVNPVHIVRYEDIKADPAKFLTPILEFVLKVNDIEGTQVHLNMLKVVEKGAP